jgi:peroxiredoxin
MMSDIFAISYATLCAMVVLEGLLLRDVLRKSAALKVSLRARARRRPQPDSLAGGTRAPDFSAPLLEGGRLALSDLEGHESTLMFVNAQEGETVRYSRLATAIHAMWHRVQGKFYLLCNGSEQECRNFMANAQLSGYKISVALDEGGEIARSFMIETTPQAVELDEDLLIGRYGSPEPEDEVREPLRAEAGNMAS